MSKRLVALLLTFSLLLAGFSTASTASLIYGRVVVDTNNNGVVDPSDNGVAAVRIRLTQNGQTVAITVTDKSGEYSLSAGAGEYTLSTSLLTVPGSYQLVISEVGGANEFNFLRAENVVFLPVVGK